MLRERVVMREKKLKEEITLLQLPLNNPQKGTFFCGKQIYLENYIFLDKYFPDNI